MDYKHRLLVTHVFLLPKMDNQPFNEKKTIFLFIIFDLIKYYQSRVLEGSE